MSDVAMAGVARVQKLSTPRRGRATTFMVLTFFVLAAGLYAFSWNHEVAGFLSDDAIYLLMADAFSPYASPEPALTAYVMRETLFPPLYPLLMAVLGAGSGSLLWAHVSTTTTLVLALGLYGFWIHSEVRDPVPAIGLLVIFALAPGTLLQNLEILSEFPYLMLSMLALWSGERARRTDRGYGLTALAVGLATLTRTAGLSLLVAFGFWLFRHRVRGRTKWFGISLLPYLLWLLYRSWIAPTKGGYVSLWEHSPASPGLISAFLEKQASALWQALLNTVDFRPSLVTQVVLGITLLLGAPVWARRLWSGRLDAWYLLVGSVMTLLYPFPGYFTRLFLPWIPIIWFYAYLGILGISRVKVQIRGKPALAYAFLAALLLASAPSLGFMFERLAEPIEPGMTAWKHTRYWFRTTDMSSIRADVRFRHDLIAAIKDVSQYVPQGECVFGAHAAISMLYSRRVFQQAPSPDVSDADFARLSNGCHYFFLVPIAGQSGNARVEPYYPQDRLLADNIDLVQAWQDPLEPNAPTAILLRQKVH